MEFEIIFLNRKEPKDRTLSGGAVVVCARLGRRSPLAGLIRPMMGRGAFADNSLRIHSLDARKCARLGK